MKDYDGDITTAHEDAREFVQKMSYQYSPMMIAAVMMVTSIKMYRDYLNHQDFEMMMAKIFTERNRVK